MPGLGSEAGVVVDGVEVLRARDLLGHLGPAELEIEAVELVADAHVIPVALLDRGEGAGLGGHAGELAFLGFDLFRRAVRAERVAPDRHQRARADS